MPYKLASYNNNITNSYCIYCIPEKQPSEADFGSLSYSTVEAEEAEAVAEADTILEEATIPMDTADYSTMSTNDAVFDKDDNSHVKVQESKNSTGMIPLNTICS